MTVQTGLCQIRSETQIVGHLMRRLICLIETSWVLGDLYAFVSLNLIHSSCIYDSLNCLHFSRQVNFLQSERVTCVVDFGNKK